VGGEEIKEKRGDRGGHPEGGADKSNFYCEGYDPASVRSPEKFEGGDPRNLCGTGSSLLVSK